MKLISLILFVSLFTLVISSPAIKKIGNDPGHVPTNPIVPIVNQNTPVCQEYRGGNYVNARVTTYPNQIDASHMSIRDKIGNVQFYVIINDGSIQITVTSPSGPPGIPARVMVKLEYNPGVQNIGQNGWWVDTTRSSTCHYNTGHSVSAIGNINYNYPH